MLFKNITVIDENYQAVPHQNILVEGNKIVSIGSEMPQGEVGEVYDGTGKIAVPGLFNLHCHVPMTLLRGYGEGLPLQNWLFDKMFPFEDLLSAEDVYWGSLLGIAEMLRSGVCSFSDMYFHMPAVAQAVDESGIKANLAHGSASGGKADCPFKEAAGYAGTLKLLDYVKPLSHDRIIVDASIHAEYTSGPVLCREVAAFAKEHHLRMQVHVSETKKEHEDCKRNRGMTPTAWFSSLGVFDVPAVAAHCVWVEDNDIALLAKHNVTVSYNPSSNLKLGSGIAPLRALRQAGIQTVFGTDGAASNNNLNMLEEIHLGAMVQKGAEQDPLFLSTADILTMACQNGALAQGRPDCGALKAENRADILIFDTNRAHMQPVIEPLSNLLYSAQSDDIVLNMVDGKVLYRDGAYLTIDIEKVLANTKQIVNEKLMRLEGKRVFE